MVSTQGLSACAPRTAVLAGPTAAGKSALALEMARLSPGRSIEIINADSMLVYRGMDIGTAKPSRSELDEIPHHLIDIRNPDEPFTAGDFVRAVCHTLQDIEGRGKRALIVGGTGFYLRALFYGLWEGPPSNPEVRLMLERLTQAELYSRLLKVDPTAALRIGVADRYRLTRALEVFQLTEKTPTQLEAEISRTPDPRFELWVVDRPQEELQNRISLRCRQMLEDGLVQEVRRIRSAYPGARALGAVGYKEVCAHLDGIAPAGRKIPSGELGLRQEIELSTRQLVKRQRTWFRSLQSRLGNAAHWFVLPTNAWQSDFRRIYPL